MQRCAAVLVNYHGAHDIAQAVRSIALDDAACEVLVDNSADAAEFSRLAEMLPSSVRLIDAKANLGFGQACNLAWQATQAPFVFRQPGCALATGLHLRSAGSAGRRCTLGSRVATAIPGHCVRMAYAASMAAHGAARLDA
jgi:GT2 family glycosyltransferase